VNLSSSANNLHTRAHAHTHIYICKLGVLDVRQSLKSKLALKPRKNLSKANTQENLEYPGFNSENPRQRTDIRTFAQSIRPIPRVSGLFNRMSEPLSGLSRHIQTPDYPAYVFGCPNLSPEYPGLY
jgi:hypothetical protein